MNTLQADFTPLRFSTADFPERDRAAALHDFFAPRVFGGEVEPLSPPALHCDMTIRQLPGLSLVSAVNSPLRFSRTAALLADGRDGYGLHMNSLGCTMSQRGVELECGPGEAALVCVGETGTTVAASTSRFLCLNISRAALAPLVADPDAAVMQRIAPNNGALQFLLNYVRFLQKEGAPANAALARKAAIHLCDLLALVLGTTRDAVFIAENRGLRAARLAAIKRFVAENLGHHALTVSAVAARHGMTPRTVQRLFEEEGTTFSKYVLSCRLTAAYRMLADASYAEWRISAIALEAGFGDVSYFNRCFRRTFGTSPTEVHKGNSG